MVITGQSTFMIRAERAGPGNGRVYTVEFQVEDEFGNATVEECSISVPKSPSSQAVDDGAVHTVTP